MLNLNNVNLKFMILYFVNIHKLMSNYMPTYVPQEHDADLTAANTVLGGCCGQVPCANPTVVALPHSSRKKEKTHDVSFRVWRLHIRVNHTSLDTLAHMVKENLLGEVDATYQEINLVADHQDCYA